MDSKDEVYDEKSAKYCAIGWTIVYLLLFPFLFYVALFSIMVFDNPHMTTPVGLLIIFMSFWVPLSIPVSIYLMWSNYSRGQYKRTHLFWGLPFFTFGIVFLLNAIIQKLFL
jgi:hypothetical protein